MSSDAVDADSRAIEGVLLAYLAARDKNAAHALPYYVGRYPHYAHELLLLTFALIADADEVPRRPAIPPEMRERLLAIARATLLADTTIDARCYPAGCGFGPLRNIDV